VASENEQKVTKCLKYAICVMVRTKHICETMTVCLCYDTIRYCVFNAVSLKPDRTTAHPNCHRQASFIASFHKCLFYGSVMVRTSIIGRIVLGVQVRASFHILSCAVVRAVVRSGFRDTLFNVQ